MSDLFHLCIMLTEVIKLSFNVNIFFSNIFKVPLGRFIKRKRLMKQQFCLRKEYRLSGVNMLQESLYAVSEIPCLLKLRWFTE